MSRHIRCAAMVICGLVLMCAQAASGAFVTFSAGGDNTAASIQGTVDAFRAALGSPNNGNAAGPLASGRREINWDGGGAATTVSGNPFNGFQNIRGTLFTTPGTGFVQAPPTGFDTTFANPTYSSTFGVFSPQRIFSPIGSNVTDVTFFIPGSGGTVPATVSGFGAVFTEVDLANTTRLQFFNVNNVEIFNQTVQPGTVPSQGLSFLGGLGNAGEQIFRVRITTGNSALGPSDGGGVDVVALDDLIYAEPAAVAGPVPLPAAWVAGMALGGAVGLMRKVRRP